MSPTCTSTSLNFNPLDSDPMLASCQAATLPLAVMRVVQLLVCGEATVTVKAGRVLGLAGSAAQVTPTMTKHNVGKVAQAARAQNADLRRPKCK